MYGPHDPIPPGIWRLGIFVLNRRVMQGYSEDYIVEYITYWSSRAGLSVAKNTLRPLSLSLTLGTDPAVAFGGWVQNTVRGLTTVEFIRRSSLPAQFYIEAAPDSVESYLNTFQGKWGAGVVEADVPAWANPDSWLQTDVWYPAAAAWALGAPSPDQLEARLKEAGCDMWSGRGRVRSFRPPQGLIFMLQTGDEPKALRQIQQAIGADWMVIDLNDAKASPMIGDVDELQEKGDEFLETIGQTVQKLADGLKSAGAGAGAALDLIGWILKYGPYIGVGALVVYGGYKYSRARKKVKKAA